MSEARNAILIGFGALVVLSLLGSIGPRPDGAISPAPPSTESVRSITSDPPPAASAKPAPPREAAVSIVSGSPPWRIGIPANPASGLVTPAGDSVILRGAPSTGAVVVMTVTSEMPAVAQNRWENWLFVRLTNGIEGWLRDEDLRRDSPPKQPREVVAAAPATIELPPSAGASDTVTAPLGFLSTSGTETVEVSADRLRMRTGPSSSAGVVATLGRGTAGRVLRQEGSWALVRLADSREGWLHRRYLSAQGTAEPPTRPRVEERALIAPPPRRAIPFAPPARQRAAVSRPQASGPVRDARTGICDCPYDRMRNGRLCGGRSAYSRPGGRSPKCYAGD